jgi:hypothetical protein
LDLQADRLERDIEEEGDRLGGQALGLAKHLGLAVHHAKLRYAVTGR